MSLIYYATRLQTHLLRGLQLRQAKAIKKVMRINADVTEAKEKLDILVKKLPKEEYLKYGYTEGWLSEIDYKIALHKITKRKRK